MKTNYLFSFIIVAVMGIFSFSSSAGTLNYTYAQNSDLYNWGLTSPQTYDIAIKLDASFAGMKVSAISVPVTVTENISDFKVWMTSKLAIDDVNGKKVNRTDIMCEQVEPLDVNQEQAWGYLSYTLPEPYNITEGGLYVGYSFTVTARGGEYEQNPVLVSVPAQEGGLYVHSSKTYRAWKDRASEVDAVSALMVSLEADIRDNTVDVAASSDMVTPAEKQYQTPVTIRNRGLNEVQKIGYTLTINGAPSQGEYIFEEPIANVFNRAATAMVEIPALEVGIYDYFLEITTVNDQPNGEKAAVQGKLHVLEILPTKRPLMEEYTGLWCGWCPRGWVAMEKMNEFHPDFVSIAYHNNDDMQMPNYPKMENGYPSAIMDRVTSCDPYTGTNNEPFGIDQLWQQMSLEYAPVEILLEAKKSEDGTRVTVTSDVYWAIEPEEGNYRVEYVLVGDGLSDKTWIQSNYYASKTAESSGIYLEMFCEGGEYGTSRVVGLVYNDVALINSGGKGVYGSIESTEAGSHSYYTHTFDLSESSLIDKAQNLRVVAMVLKDNDQFGKVINSNKTQVLTEADGISAVSTSNDIVSLKYYDLTGREIANPANGGMYIRSAQYSDGHIVATKILK